MHSDDWMDETVPGRRAASSRDPGRLSRSSRGAVPAYVWAFGLLALLLVLAICGLWGLYIFRGGGAVEGPTPTAIIWTATPSPRPTETPSPAPAEPTPEGGEGDEIPTPTASSDIAIGRYVEVAGTGGLGLSLREGPGTNYARRDLATEGEVFIVVEGPTTAGGSPWWRIRDPENEERAWWAIGNYLKPVGEP